MVRPQHLGNDFDKKIFLDLLPGIDLGRGYFSIEVELFHNRPSDNSFSMSHSSWNHYGPDKPYVLIGSDVRELRVRLHRHNSFPSGPAVNYRYSMRVDQLLLLNLAVKLNRPIA